MTVQAVKLTAALAQRIGYRKAVPPEPKAYPQCRNCASFAYDHDDYMNAKGQVAFRKSNTRCALHGLGTTAGYVCDSHAFARADRSNK